MYLFAQLSNRLWGSTGARAFMQQPEQHAVMTYVLILVVPDKDKKEISTIHSPLVKVTFQSNQFLSETRLNPANSWLPIRCQNLN